MPYAVVFFDPLTHKAALRLKYHTNSRKYRAKEQDIILSEPTIETDIIHSNLTRKMLKYSFSVKLANDTLVQRFLRIPIGIPNFTRMIPIGKWAGIWKTTWDVKTHAEQPPTITERLERDMNVELYIINSLDQPNWTERIFLKETTPNPVAIWEYHDFKGVYDEWVKARTTPGCWPREIDCDLTEYMKTHPIKKDTTE
jgi:hypothetical protein